MITLAPTIRMVITRSMSRSLSASASSNKSTIEDRPDESAFYMPLNSDYATVEYTREGNVFNLTFSNIPDAHQGKGYGQILAKQVFDYIANNNYRMKLTCEFLQNVYEKNQDKYKRYVV